MSKTKILARSIRGEINTGTDAVPVWTPIGGETSHTFDSDKTDVDDTDFDSDGWAEHKVVQRGRSISLEGFYKADPVTGAKDAGQEALLALSDAVGYDSTKPYRIIYPGGDMTLCDVSADAKVTGGGTNDNAGFSAELTVSGKPTYVPAP